MQDGATFHLHHLYFPPVKYCFSPPQSCRIGKADLSPPFVLKWRQEWGGGSPGLSIWASLLFLFRQHSSRKAVCPSRIPCSATRPANVPFLDEPWTFQGYQNKPWKEHRPPSEPEQNLGGWKPSHSLWLWNSGQDLQALGFQVPHLYSGGNNTCPFYLVELSEKSKGENGCEEFLIKLQILYNYKGLLFLDPIDWL